MSIIYTLDKRCQEILKILMYAKGYVKAQDLADELHISKRSIYYDLTKINEWLTDNDLPLLIQERGKGVLVPSDAISLIQKKMDAQDLGNLPVFTPEDRQYIEICTMICKNRKLYIEDFIDLCQVSRNTIINDLKAVIRFLKQYNIELHYDIKSGYEIIGEAVKKRAIFFMLFPQILNHYQNRKILTEYEDEVISTLSKLRHIEEELDTEYVSGILPTLALFMATLPNQHDTLNFADMDEEEIVQTKEYNLVQKYFSNLETSEKIYVTLHLLGSRLQTIPVNVSKEQGETYEMSKLLVSEFERLSYAYFKQEDELINAINAHLKTSLYRYRYGIQLGNPLLNNIKTEYEELFELTKKACHVLEKKIGTMISDAEVAYLTLHFGAFLTINQDDKKEFRILIICPNGIGTGNMLRNEITALIPQATEICNLPLSLYNENHGYDIVISTVILPNEKKLVVVHPILTDQDRVTILRNCMYTDPHVKMQIDEITKIASSYMNPTNLIKFQKSLQEYYSSIQIPKVPHRNFGQTLSYYLSAKHIQVCSKEVDWEEALRISCKPLLEDRSISESYVNAIINDQKYKGLYMFLADDLVLAHSAIENGVHHVDVSLCTFKKPVRFLNGKYARIILVLAAEDQTKHIRILNDVLDIFSKKKSIDQIVDLDSPLEISHYIATHID